MNSPNRVRRNRTGGNRTSCEFRGRNAAICDLSIPDATICNFCSVDPRTLRIAARQNRTPMPAVESITLGGPVGCKRVLCNAGMLDRHKRLTGAHLDIGCSPDSRRPR